MSNTGSTKRDRGVSLPPVTLDPEWEMGQVDRLLTGMLRDPHGFLGLHPFAAGLGRPRSLVARAFSPGAERATLVERGGAGARFPLARLADPGVFRGVIPERAEVFAYELEFERDGHTWVQGDPYRFLPTVGEQDLYFLGEGSHRRLFDVLGAHPRVIDGVAGVSFAVWAPNALGVSLVGDFNGWHRRGYPLRSLGPTGIWELFVPGLAAGDRYKFAIRGADGVEQEKADPVAFQSEVRPQTASVVADVDTHAWQDGAWMAARAQRDFYSGPFSVYEVHLGSWRRHANGAWLTYRELADTLLPYVQQAGFTHIELLPVSEHPFDGSWGYQVTNFYAVTSRFGAPEDFQEFVDRCHQGGIGVLMDWVPAHFATDPHGLERFDGTFLYEHADPLRRYQPDWGTLIFNYGRHEVRNFLIANALFWIEKFHIDGLRVDAVSAMLYLDYSRGPGQWTPNKYGGRENLEALAFLREVNELVYGAGTGAITVAEESTAWPGVSRPVYANGLGFGFKWNMGWMHDTLEYFRQDPVYRRYYQRTITFSLVYAFSENFVLALSHDEVVHGKGSLFGKMPGDEWQKFANLRALLAYQHAMPGKKLIFMGDEFGQRGEWNHDSELAWQSLGHPLHAGLARMVAELNRLHRELGALHQRDHDTRGFEWLDFNDSEQSVVSFLRRGANPEDVVLCIFNLTPVVRHDYWVPMPGTGVYREVFNSDSAYFGGSGVGNGGVVTAIPRAHLGRTASACLTLPPLGALFLRPAPAGGGDDLLAVLAEEGRRHELDRLQDD